MSEIELVYVRIKKDRVQRFISLLNFIKIREEGDPLILAKSKYKFSVVREKRNK